MDIIKIEQLLKNHEERISKLEADTSIGKQSESQVIKKELSIKEFILQKKPDGMYQMGLAIGYYFERHQSMSSFTSEDLAEGFRQAKEPLPINLSAVIYKNAERGFLMEAKEKKKNKNAWVLTNSGEKLVENGFQKTNKK